MPPPYCYDYPRPAVTVDLAAFVLEGDALRVLLIKRKKDPYAGSWALPGGFLDIDEPVEAAVRREMREESGLDVRGPVAFIGVFGAPDRDPRGRTISLAHAIALRGPVGPIAAADDTEEAAWLDPHSQRGLAFDHDAIQHAALEWLKRGVLDGPIGLALLPLEFGDDTVCSLHRAVLGSSRGALTWRKRLERSGLIAAVEGEGTELRYRSVD